MEELKVFDKLEVKTINVECGVITILMASTGISCRGNIGWDNKTVLTNYVYKKDETYDLVYSIIDIDGKIQRNYLENNGILPTLFKSPDNELYVSIVVYDPDKELEMSVPVLNRKSFEIPKPNRPFSGKYFGNINQSCIFYDIDIFSDKKQDKLLNIEFKNGIIKKKHNIKIDFPKDNKIYIRNNEIHLLGKDKNLYIHRQIDEFGKEIKQRKINLGTLWCREVFELKFDNISSMLCNDNGKIMLLEVDENGKINVKNLIDIGDQIYNTWKPIEIGNNSYVIQYNTGFGNGWFTIKEKELVEVYYGKGGKGYKNLLTNKIIDMGNNDLILYGINETEINKYAIVFYGNAKNLKNNKEIIILNKNIV
jgi:hypothetical protein